MAMLPVKDVELVANLDPRYSRANLKVWKPADP